MKVYCAHADKVFSKGSNYYKCPQCRRGWYKSEAVPLVLLGFTDSYEASDAQFEKKDLSKKQFKRCKHCKDLLEKKSHVMCKLRAELKVYKQRHNETMANIMMVVRGFKRDK